MKCFNYYAKSSKNNFCKKNDCRYSIDCKEFKNCSIVAAKKGPQTLQCIGEIYGITRMRICQIEKSIISKIKKSTLSALKM
jgi:hypothetical protein